MSDSTCKNCRWWGRAAGTSVGECKINPPVTHPVSEQRENQRGGLEADWETRWPITDELDWCGQFRYEEK